MCFSHKYSSFLLNSFFILLSFSENTSQVAAILVCYSPVDGEIGSKQFAMSETPIWSSITAGSELCFDQRRSVCNQRCSLHTITLKNSFSVWQINLINDLHIFHGNNMLYYQKQCKKVLRVHKTLLFNRNSCFHLLNLLKGRIRSVLFTLFKSLYLLVRYYVYQSTNIVHLWGLLGLTTTFLIIGSETFGFSSEMFAPQNVLDSYPKMLLIPILVAKLFWETSLRIWKVLLM